MARLGDILVRRGYVTPGQLEAALSAQGSERGMLGRILVRRGLITMDQLGESLAELRSWVTALGHTGVVTYINTGNVIFSVDDVGSAAAQDNAALAAELEARIARESGLRIPVLVRTREELAEAVAANPFPGADPSKLIVAFMNDAPDAETLERWGAVESGNDEMAVIGTVVYLHCPDGLGRSKLGEKLLGRGGPLGTTRNLRTVRKLVELAG
jgi:uncharacterized protein (DUF1697 family)